MTDTPATDTPAADTPEAFGIHTTTSCGQSVWHCTAENYLPLVAALHADGFRFCADVCAVDTLTNTRRVLPPEVPAQRYEVVVNLLDMSAPSRTRIRAQVSAEPASTQPAIASITHLFPGAEALEREAADLFGITFVGHPDPTRILMPEDWEGHPLRKDYEVGDIPVQFKAVPGR